MMQVWRVLTLCCLAWILLDARSAFSNSFEVKAMDAVLSLSDPKTVTAAGSFVQVRLQAVLTDAGGQRQGSVLLEGVPRFVPPKGAALRGAVLLGMELGPVAPSVLEALRQALRLRLVQGLDLPMEALTGSPPAPLNPGFPDSVPGLLRLWPRVEVRTRPAVLVQIAGEPLLVGIPGTDLDCVANTDGDLFFHRSGYKHYLLLGSSWFEAFSLSGPWLPLQGALPPAFSRIPASHPKAHVKRFVDLSPSSSPSPAASTEIVAAQEPTELVLFDGAPVWEAIAGTGFSYGKNTESDIFQAKDGVVLLASGRWFAARSLKGPWQGLGSEVPPGLEKLPPSHPRAHVRLSVPGTPEARSALERAHAVQAVTIRRDAELSLRLQDAPRLVPLVGSLRVVKNTAEDMLEESGRYFVCRQGVWYAASQPSGPWSVAFAGPPSLDLLPPSSSWFHLRFVRALAWTPSTATFGFTSSYQGAFPDGPLVVYGTGYSEPGILFKDVYYGLPPVLGISRRLSLAGGALFEERGASPSLFPRWGRVSYGQGLRGSEPPPSGIVDVRQLSPASLPELPRWYVGQDGLVYRQSGQSWWVNSSERPVEWKPCPAPPSDVVFQSTRSIEI